MKRLSIALTLFVTIVVLCLFAACADNSSEAKVEEAKAAAQANPNAYPFNIQVQSPDDKVWHSAEVLPDNGKPTLVMFWLTTCAPCKVELAAIEREYPKWKAETDFNIVAISTDWEKNYDEFVRRVEEHGWEWNAYWDKNRSFRDVLPGKLNGLPQTFIFDANGKIVYQKRKYRPGDEHKLYTELKRAADISTS